MQTVDVMDKRVPTVSGMDIRDGVLSLGITPGETVLVHSSLSSFPACPCTQNH